MPLFTPSFDLAGARHRRLGAETRGCIFSIAGGNGICFSSFGDGNCSFFLCSDNGFVGLPGHSGTGNDVMGLNFFAGRGSTRFLDPTDPAVAKPPAEGGEAGRLFMLLLRACS